jgi:hypothetical protein
MIDAGIPMLASSALMLMPNYAYNEVKIQGLVALCHSF